MNDIYFYKLKKIFNNPDTFIIFGSDYCFYCKESINLLKKHKKNFTFLDIKKNPKLFFNLIGEFCNKNKSFQFNHAHKTIPIIFYNNKFVGGYSDLINLLK